jgi:hypothetical protein
MKYTIQLKCIHPGCKEWSFYNYSTKKDYLDAKKRRAGDGWKCIRHSDDRLLTKEKLTATKTFIADKSSRFPNLDGLYWNDSSGFASGSSWKAFADDFPPGTKIIETVQVILPKDQP